MTHTILAAADAVPHAGNDLQLILAALVGIATIIVLIVWTKVHPFLALTLGSAVLALVAGIPLADTFTAFTSGLGSTIGDVGTLIAFGAIIGKLLIDSGGADQIVDTILDHTSASRLPWAMALIAFVVGIPLFFEVGIVLLIPVVMMVARRARQPLVLVGVPALAGLSALHGLVPPHPGPLIAIDAVGANLGITLGFGLLVAIPTVIVAGPLSARLMARWVPIEAPEPLGGSEQRERSGARPSFGVSISVVLLPVLLMLMRTVVETLVETKSPDGSSNPLAHFALFLGQPIVALLLTVLVAILVFGVRMGDTADEISARVGGALGPIAGILLIVGAGGGFKQTLIESGIATIIAGWLEQAAVPALLAGWLVAVAVRLATGSATVATITAAGIMAPLASDMPPVEAALLVLAIGAGSVFLSHVNDAGFWLVKEYFGMTVGQTFKTWSLMETILSVTALVVVLVLALLLGVL
ncbi:gluconate transporter [Actinomyces sp. 432]|uniref:GntP family permease n=1 Tax=unclassified Actinomyces TaxID=2609248 RepID=UPI0013739BF9|nr:MULTISPECIES: gluconate:H+ symporter [unclassified Actinomyces]MBW3068439.1 gluconate transporter [Actinomyces sp. 594]QHO90268.1 gluconate transporter [Actinomyces sp. 432]